MIQSSSQKYLVLFFVYILIVIIASFIVLQLFQSKNTQKTLSQERMIQEAKAHFDSMVDTRSWNAQYGGVFVKSKELKPNPYLKNNILYTDKNETLIKINPAWMTRQISDISNKQKRYHFKITSLMPLNPSNKADSFEQEALVYFEKNNKSPYFYHFNEQTGNFNFMGALVTKQGCLKCHEHQGYKVGDIRGGIRVSIPSELYQEEMSLLNEKTRQSTMVVVITALLLAILITWVLHMFYRRQYEIEHMNEILENKVSERTHKLEQVLSHEQHLKEVLKTIAGVNELLITSFSMKSTLQNSAQQLSYNKAYSFVWAGLVKENILEITYQSARNSMMLDSELVDLDCVDKDELVFSTVKKAIRIKHSIIEKLSKSWSQTIETRRENDLDMKWLIALPLVHNSDESPFGIITVFCSREEGFEPEEINILENMAHDISMALYSHKQRDAVLQMEKEKVENYEETILAFVNIIEQRDTFTAGHTIRVAEYCELIARGMGYEEDEVRRLEKAAILHDIGKVATPDAILLKPGRLSLLEYELIKQHSEVGANMLKQVVMYEDLAEIIRFHHSRYDGKGYPRTKSPDEIPMLTHIMIVADAFDAMTTNRIYKPRKSIEDALSELEHQSGIQFHPKVVSIAMKVLRQVDLSSTNQMPKSELEQHRMSYFFQDKLTELYNEDYLKILLNGEEHQYQYLNIIDLNKFTSYNKKHGWESGSILLQEMAAYLQKQCGSGLVIRYHGDNFIVLSNSQFILDKRDLLERSPLKGKGLEVSIRYYNIDSKFTFEKFLELEH